MSDILSQQSVYTVTLAAAYALFATGFILVFGVLDVLNLAHAYVFMFCAEVAVWLITHDWPILLAVVGAVMVGVVMGLVIDLIAYRPVVNRNVGGGLGASFPPVISTLGVAFMIYGLATNLFGIGANPVPKTNLPETAWNINGIRVTLIQVAVVLVAVVVLTILSRVLSRTAYGRAVRAVAENRDMAAQLGVNTMRLSTSVWVLASALAGLAGVCIGLLYNSVSPEMGASFELRGFIAVILGGLGSVAGAVVAAILLAVLETGTVLYVSSQARDVITMSAILVLLLIRPNGIFGRRSRVV
jgi:branched-chain amino acid transport system permease protein